MSAKKKPKKLRRPNIVTEGLTIGPAESRGGGAEPGAPMRSEAGRLTFDYTYVKRDMRRIGLYSALCVTIIVVLSFFLR